MNTPPTSVIDLAEEIVDLLRPLKEETCDRDFAEDTRRVATLIGAWVVERELVELTPPSGEVRVASAPILPS
jgi:hypothetical protein